MRFHLPSLLQISTSIEQIWVHIHISNKHSIIIGSVYCPPNSSITVLDELETTINDIRNSHPSAIIILGGDFNASGIDWKHKSLTNSYVSVPFREKPEEGGSDISAHKIYIL